MLSFLRFLIRISTYANSDISWRGLVGTDSQSMLDRLFKKGTDPSNHKELAILDVLDAEWDLLVEIQHALRELPGADRTYVKGHQDDKKVYAKLPLMAQLNVDADRLSGKYNQDHGARRPFSFLAPNTGTFLKTVNGTMTSNFAQELRTRSTGPDLEAYIREKNKWDHNTFDVVNWTAHGKAVKATSHTRIHLTKFLHDSLPTYHRANLLDNGNRKCVACGTSDETTDHIFLCQAASRTEWRTSFRMCVDSFHDAYQTHPLRKKHLFWEAMDQWFNPASPDIVSPVLFPVEVRSLILTQNKIGWRQVLRGRFSQEWYRIQNACYMKHRQKSAFKRTGERWQQLIMVIWSSWFQLWTSTRNGEVHRTTTETRAMAQRKEVCRQLTEIYASRAFMEPKAEELLESDPETHMQRPTHVNKNWMAMAGPAIRRSVRRIKKVLLQGVRSLQTYFPRTGEG